MKISIIIPTFNRADLLPETLNSIKLQSDSNWECLLIDDGSNEETWNLLNDFVSQEPKFQLFKREDFNRPKGANACRNIGINKASGDYLIFFDSDDLMTQNCIEDHRLFIKENKPDLNILQSVYFGGKRLESQKIVSGNIHSPNLIEEFFKKETVWITHNPAVSKAFLLQHQIGYDESLKAAQDWEFFMKILVRNPKITSFDRIGTQMRIHQESISGNLDSRAQKYFHYYKARHIIFHTYLNERQKADLEPYFKEYSENFLIELIKMEKFDWAKEIIANESKGSRKVRNLAFLEIYKATQKGLSKISLS